MSIGVRGDLPASRRRSAASAFDVLPMPTISASKGTGSPDRRRQRRLGHLARGEALTQALDFLHYFFSPPGYAAAERDVRNRARRDEHRRRPEGPVGARCRTTRRTTSRTRSPRTASRRSRRRRPGTVFSNSQTNIPNAIEAVLAGNEPAVGDGQPADADGRRLRGGAHPQAGAVVRVISVRFVWCKARERPART